MITWLVYLFILIEIYMACYACFHKCFGKEKANKIIVPFVNSTFDSEYIVSFLLSLLPHLLYGTTHTEYVFFWGPVTGPIPNGDFETSPLGGFPSEDAISDGPTTIPNWKLHGTVELVESGQKQGGMILIVPQGRHAVRLGNDAEISQDIPVEKGSIYSVTFSAARTCAQLESLNVSVGAASQTIDLQTLYNVQGWDPYAVAFDGESDKVTLAFRNPGMEDDPTCGPIIDDIAIKKLFSPDQPKGEKILSSSLSSHFILYFFNAFVYCFSTRFL